MFARPRMALREQYWKHLWLPLSVSVTGRGKKDRLIADVTPARGRKVFQDNDLLKF